MFTGWTLYISLSNSSLLPTYGFVGLENYASLWANRRWNIAYTNLFLFSGFYVVGSMAVGLLLAILIDQRVRGEAVWRTIFLYPLAVSFIVTGTVWSWLYNPDRRHPGLRARARLDRFQLRADGRPQLSRSTRSSSPASGSRRALPWRCSWPGCARSIRT